MLSGSRKKMPSFAYVLCLLPAVQEKKKKKVGRSIRHSKRGRATHSCLEQASGLPARIVTAVLLFATESATAVVGSPCRFTSGYVCCGAAERVRRGRRPGCWEGRTTHIVRRKRGTRKKIDANQYGSSEHVRLRGHHPAHYYIGALYYIRDGDRQLTRPCPEVDETALRPQ